MTTTHTMQWMIEQTTDNPDAAKIHIRPFATKVAAERYLYRAGYVKIGRNDDRGGPDYDVRWQREGRDHVGDYVHAQIKPYESYECYDTTTFDAEWERMEQEATEAASRIIHAKMIKARSENPGVIPQFISNVTVHVTVDGQVR